MKALLALTIVATLASFAHASTQPIDDSVKLMREMMSGDPSDETLVPYHSGMMSLYGRVPMILGHDCKVTYRNTVWNVETKTATSAQFCVGLSTQFPHEDIFKTIDDGVCIQAATVDSPVSVERSEDFFGNQVITMSDSQTGTTIELRKDFDTFVATARDADGRVETCKVDK